MDEHAKDTSGTKKGSHISEQFIQLNVHHVMYVAQHVTKHTSANKNKTNAMCEMGLTLA